MNKQTIFEFPSDVQWIAGPGNILSRIEFCCPDEVRSAKIWLVTDPHSYAKEYWQKLRNDGHDGGWLLGGSFLKYRIFVNGGLIGVGPARPVDNGIPAVHCFEVDLQKGRNVLGVFSRGEKKGFALCLEAILSNGEIFQLQSGGEWKALNINQCYSPVCWEKQNIDQFFKGCAGPGEWPEHIDGTKYPFGWNDTGFDDRDWLNAAVIGPVTEKTESHDVQNYNISKISPASIRKVDKQRWLIDFGQEYIGGIELTGPSIGNSIELCLGEELISENQVRYQMRTGNSYHEIWRFPDGKRTLSHFGLRSFRYLELIGYADELNSEMVRIISITAPFNKNESSFSCENNDLGKVWDFCKNSIAFTSMDIYNDCFSRERTAYEADSYICMLSHFSVESNTAVAKRTIEYLVRHNTWPCEWQMMMIPLFYEYYMHTGELAFVKEYYSYLRNHCLFLNLLKDDIVWDFPLEVIVDWPKKCQDNFDFGPGNTVANALLYWVIILFAKLTNYCGDRLEAKKMLLAAAKLKENFNQRLFDSQTGLYVDHFSSKHSSLHTNMFALRFGLVPDNRINSVLDFVVGKRMACSVYVSQFLLETLFIYGRAEEAVALMVSSDENSWLNMLRQGATVTMEAWTPQLKDNLSWAHPWGAAPANIIARYLFGLRPTAPGWKHFDFNPVPGGIKSAKLVIPTPRGKIYASFKVDADKNLIKSVWTDFDCETSEILRNKRKNDRRLPVA